MKMLNEFTYIQTFEFGLLPGDDTVTIVALISEEAPPELIARTKGKDKASGLIDEQTAIRVAKSKSGYTKEWIQECRKVYICYGLVHSAIDILNEYGNEHGIVHTGFTGLNHLELRETMLNDIIKLAQYTTWYNAIETETRTERKIWEFSNGHLVEDHAVGQLKEEIAEGCYKLDEFSHGYYFDNTNGKYYLSISIPSIDWQDVPGGALEWRIGTLLRELGLFNEFTLNYEPKENK